MFKKYFKKRRKITKKSAVSQLHYRHNKEFARQIISSRVEYFANECHFTYGRIAIRNSRRSWGSCSSLGNLNFHYRLAFLPKELLDYVVVHELCHLRHFNHSPAFWAEVAKILPTYQSLRADLRQYEKSKTTHVMIVT